MRIWIFSSKNTSSTTAEWPVPVTRNASEARWRGFSFTIQSWVSNVLAGSLTFRSYSTSTIFGKICRIIKRSTSVDKVKLTKYLLTR
jgi:hypothetical protein